MADSRKLKSEGVVMQFDLETNFENYFTSDEVFSSPIDSTYSDLALLFLTELSKSILKDKSAKHFPDLITFAYFCRKSNLINFKKDHLDPSVNLNRFGCGVCLHIAPANIPMNFAFSFIMGFMSGNKNIVRLPSKQFEQISIFIDNYNRVIATDQFMSLQEKNLFVRTERDSNKLISLVAQVDALVVWGGDATVSQFRKLDKKPSCIEVYFPDRVSSLVINCEYLLNQSSENIRDICIGFYNDTYLVDQNACSSASMIFWYSQNNNFAQAKAIFTENLLNYLEESYNLEPISRIEKNIDIIRFCKSIDDSVEIEKAGDKLWYIKSDNHKPIKPKLGVFVSKDINELGQLSSLFRDNEQTLTYLGLNSKTILNHLSSDTSRIIDRVVPLGKALDIGFIWDGRNMIYALSKYVNIQ
jgi:hypothetical protein